MNVITLFGVCALGFMMLTAPSNCGIADSCLRSRSGCLLSSAYGFIFGAWPFGVVEVMWAGDRRSALSSWAQARPPTNRPSESARRDHER